MPHRILWDGDCGFCRRVVEWFLRHDKQGLFEAIPYQDDTSITPELRQSCTQAVHVITTDGRILKAGRATLFLLEQIGCRRLAKWLAWPPFLRVVEAFYRFVARHRSLFDQILFPRARWKGESCYVRHRS